MIKVDFKKNRKDLYLPTRSRFTSVEVPSMPFLMVDGEGDPNASAAYAQAVEALYTASYAVKLTSRNELGQDYVVPPLEGLWSAADRTAFVRRAKDEWVWTMMIRLPDWVMPGLVHDTLHELARNKQLPGLAGMRRETLVEGRSVQILHVGPYDAEGPVLATLHNDYLPAHDLVPNGRHHEIYLSDARRTDPTKLKTVLRQPVADAAPRGADAGQPI